MFRCRHLLATRSASRRAWPGVTEKAIYRLSRVTPAWTHSSSCLTLHRISDETAPDYQIRPHLANGSAWIHVSMSCFTAALSVEAAAGASVRRTRNCHRTDRHPFAHRGYTRSARRVQPHLGSFSRACNGAWSVTWSACIPTTPTCARSPGAAAQTAYGLGARALAPLRQQSVSIQAKVADLPPEI